MKYFKLFEEHEENIAAKFSALQPSDISLKSKNVSAYHMQLVVSPKDNELRKAYTSMMYEEFDENYTIVDVEKDSFNRLHINSIPSELRGISLGRKIYQAVIAKLGIISTTSGSSEEEVKYIWKSLCKRPEYFFFKDDYKTILVLSELANKYYPSIKAYFKERGTKVKTNYRPAKKPKNKAKRKASSQLEIEFNNLLPK